MKKITAIIAFGLITFSSFGQWSDTSNNETQGAVKLKSYLLFDADGDFTGGNYFTIQDDPTNNHLRIGYGFNNHFTMNSSGNIGIGTTNPGAQLELNGGSLLLKGKNNDAGDLIFRTNTASQLGRIWTKSTGESGLYLSSGDNTADLTISESGNIGIGTWTPSAKLELYGKGNLLIKGSDNDAGDLVFQTNTATQLARIWTNNTGESGLFLSSGDNAADLTISKSGYVGIGSQNPDSKLTVKGKIHCEEVQVDLAVPADYVFEKYYKGFSTLKADYSMPTLEEVEAYTKENHHLPSIPSAKTIQDEGLYLKEMTNLLLQKIEELTLYTIEQEKRIKVLEGKID